MKSKFSAVLICGLLAAPIICYAGNVKSTLKQSNSCQIIKPADLSSVLYNDLYCCKKSGTDRLTCLKENVIAFKTMINHAANLTSKLNSAIAAKEIRNKMISCRLAHQNKTNKNTVKEQATLAKCYYNVYRNSAEPHLNMAIDECTP